MYEYNCELVRIIDGDTIVVSIDLGFKVWLRKETVRLMGINCPESRTRHLAEKELGLAAKNRLKELIPRKFKIITHKDRKGKFGRLLAEPIVDHPEYGFLNICDRMLEEGHAQPYYGGTKPKWI